MVISILWKPRVSEHTQYKKEGDKDCEHGNNMQEEEEEEEE